MNRRKAIIVVFVTVLLLTFTVSGTVAWIMDKTDPVTNVFLPTEVETSIVEEFDKNTTKSSIVIKNLAETGKNKIPVYVRVALVGNWCDAVGNVVEPWIPNFTLGSDWFKAGDYYYYSKVLNVGGETSDLLGSDISGVDGNKKGLHLVVDVMHQSIQAEPASVVNELWGVNVTNGILSAN